MDSPRRTQSRRRAEVPSCACLDSLDAYDIDTRVHVNVSTSQGVYLYPSSYGLSKCAAHDSSLQPFCDAAVPPAWCFRAWCYVNASECDASASVSLYLEHHARGGEVFYSYEACGQRDAFASWFAAFAGTIQLCSVFASKSEEVLTTPCGNTATHLQVEAMVSMINNLTGGLGFHVVANNPSFPSYYHFRYTYHVYPKGAWDAVGRNLSEHLFPQCDIIVGQGHGCSDVDIRAQALVAHAHAKLYFTLRGPRAVLAKDSSLSTRLSPYFFSTHIRSDFYAYGAMRRVVQRSRAIHAAKGGASGSSAPPVRIAILNFAHNAFFDGVAVEALNFASRADSGYEVACYNVTKSSGEEDVARAVDGVIAAQPDLLLVSSLAEGFSAVLTQLSKRRYARVGGETIPPLARHVLKGVFWVGVPWLANGIMSCKGLQAHCAYAVGATQISEHEADTFEDALLQEHGVPTTYAWLKATNEALRTAYGTTILKAEADAAIIPSVIAQVMADIFRSRAPASRSQPLQSADDYERVRARLASGEVVARTYYGDIAFDSFGSNKGREATSFQTDATGIARIISPEWLPDARVLIYPAPAVGDAPRGENSYDLDYGEACDTDGFKFIGNKCGVCDADQLPCGTIVGASRCLLCRPHTYNAVAPPRLPLAIILGVPLGLLAFCAVLIALLVRHSQKKARALNVAQMRRVTDAIDDFPQLRFLMALMPATDFVTHGELKTFEWLRNRHRLQYYDTIEAMKQLHQSGHYVVFISHQWTSFSHGPDPSGEQYRSIVAGVSHIAQEQDWPLDMVLVWVDYSCIPQENKTMSREAIKTLPAYVTFSDAFLIASPELPHRNPTKPGEMCNLLSYRNRLLCRVEQLSFMLVNKLEHMYVTENVGEVVSASQDEKSLLEACFVFDGEATDERDKLWLVEPLLGLYAMMLAKKSQQGNAAVSHPLQRLLFERLDSEEFLSRLFPSEIIVRMVLEHGRRLEKVPPEKHTLFGDLLWRTKKLVEARLESS